MENSVHPTALVGADVELGTGNTVGPYAVLLGPLRIGDDNWIGPNVCIGTPAEMRGGQHPAAWEAPADHQGVVIGDRNVIREFVTVQAPAEGQTRIGDDCYVMTKAHVPHDGVLGDRVTVSCGVLIGGHCVIGDGANLGLNAVLHQRIVVGAGAMVGMAAVVTRHVPPFATAFGTPARVRSANVIGLRRYGLDDSVIVALDRAYRDGDVDPAEPPVPSLWRQFEAAVAIAGAH